MTPEQIQRAKAIVEYAAVNSLETEEVQLLGWALQHVAAQGKRIAELEAGRVVVPEPTHAEFLDLAASAHVSGDLVDFMAGAAAYGIWLRGKVCAIPADRVLGEGMLSIHPKVLESISETLREIGDMAHNASTGPEVPDVLWEIRGKADEAYIAATDAEAEIVQTANALAAIDALRAQAGKDAT